jgi:stage V sporulation protein R
MSKKLPQQSEWNFDSLQQYASVIDDIAVNELKLDVYPNQIEIITSEQMIDAYASVGMPIYYNHWSFGKKVIRDFENYKKGRMGLAYEIVINSNPCIVYCMEENTLPMQALVIAHAGYGHNAIFKNNYLFKQRTVADAIIDYLMYAKDYIRMCEEKYGIREVEHLLDCAHALSLHAYNHHPKPSRISKSRREMIAQQRSEEDRKYASEFWDTVVKKGRKKDDQYLSSHDIEPEENLLYFFEKYSPSLEEWEREILRIVRKVQEYFYPQMQTKLLNEGFATFVHYTIMNMLSEKGYVDEGFMLEILHSHTNVIRQPMYNERGFQINVYALGFAIFQDIVRMCTNPTDEDLEWCPILEGMDWLDAVKHAAFDYRDETFILQFLSPKVMRDFQMFTIRDYKDKDHYLVTNISNDEGYMNIRKTIAEHYNILNRIPNISIVDCNFKGDRTLVLQHSVRNGRLLDPEYTGKVLTYMSRLWNFNIELYSVDEETGEELDVFSYE